MVKSRRGSERPQNRSLARPNRLWAESECVIVVSELSGAYVWPSQLDPLSPAFRCHADPNLITLVRRQFCQTQMCRPNHRDGRRNIVEPNVAVCDLQLCRKPVCRVLVDLCY